MEEDEGRGCPRAALAGDTLPEGVPAKVEGHVQATWQSAQSVRTALLGRLVSLAGNALVLVILVFFCSGEQRGIYSNASTVFSLVAVLELGLGNSAVPHFRFLAEQRNEKGIEGARLLASYWALSLWMALGLCLVMGLFSILGAGAAAAFFRSPAWFVLLAISCVYLHLLPALFLLEGAIDIMKAQVMKLAQAVAALVAVACLLAWDAGWAVCALVGLHAGVAGWFVRRDVWVHLPGFCEIRRVFQWFPHAVDQGRIFGALTASICPAIAHSGGLFLVTQAWGMGATGQFGLTISLATVPLNVSMAWLLPRTPEIAREVALGRFQAADALAHIAQRHVVRVVVSLSLLMLVSLVVLRSLSPALASRFLGPQATLACLCLSCAYAWHWVKTVHLRSYGVEGLVPANVTATVLSLGLLGLGVGLGASPEQLAILWGYGSAIGVVLVTHALFPSRHRAAGERRGRKVA